MKMEDKGNISDGYHTFNELYEHRHTLFILLCKIVWEEKDYPVWRSKKHSDGTMYDGWFIMGINKNKGMQISYHLPLYKWGQTEFAETLECAPQWDGHNSNDVLQRLELL